MSLTGNIFSKENGKEELSRMWELQGWCVILKSHACPDLYYNFAIVHSFLETYFEVIHQAGKARLYLKHNSGLSKI